MDSTYIEEIAQIIDSTRISRETIENQLSQALANVSKAESINTTPIYVEVRECDNYLFKFHVRDIKDLYFNNTKIGGMFIQDSNWNTVRIFDRQWNSTVYSLDYLDINQIVSDINCALDRLYHLPEIKL